MIRLSIMERCTHQRDNQPCTYIAKLQLATPLIELTKAPKEVSHFQES